MSCLVYCILNGQRLAPRPVVAGVRGHVLWMVECEGLCAAVSREEAPAENAPLHELIAYAKAIEALQRGETVVPMRYGCRFAAAAQVGQWMRGCAAHLRALLGRVDGCVEMGLRAIPWERRPGAASRAPAPSGRGGAAYLAGRREQIARWQRCEELARTIGRALEGKYRQCCWQVQSCGPRPILSLCFLVQRGAVAAFREAFACLEQADAALMLSGPWPPYNFVRDLPAGPQPAAGVGPQS